ncbi:hypothetical protein A2U01_0084744, partial [Trifolium medium]|nr:hypothetical protein [Trifolium medium]
GGCFVSAAPVVSECLARNGFCLAVFVKGAAGT